MNEQNGSDSKTVKVVARNLLMVIGFFIVYICGFATLVMVYGSHLEIKAFILIATLASFPLLVFFGIFYLVRMFWLMSNPSYRISEIADNSTEWASKRLQKTSIGEIEDKSETSNK